MSAPHVVPPGTMRGRGTVRHGRIDAHAGVHTQGLPACVTWDAPVCAGASCHGGDVVAVGEAVQSRFSGVVMLSRGRLSRVVSWWGTHIKEGGHSHGGCPPCRGPSGRVMQTSGPRWQRQTPRVLRYLRRGADCCVPRCSVWTADIRCNCADAAAALAAWRDDRAVRRTFLTQYCRNGSMI